MNGASTRGLANGIGVPQRLVLPLIHATEAERTNGLLVMRQFLRHWTVASLGNGIAFGGAVAGVGDVDGDGQRDLLIGAARNGRQPLGSGRILLFSYRPDDRTFLLRCELAGTNRDGDFGGSLAAAGDINQDGFADVLVTDRWPVAGVRGRQDRVQLFAGNPGGLRPAPVSQAVGQINSFLGINLASGADVNGDGFADVLFGAPNHSSGDGAQEGKALLYLGSTNFLGTNPVWSHAGGRVGRQFGNSVAIVGDVNGDKFTDLLVGSPKAENGPVENAGRICLFYGSAQGFPKVASWVYRGGLQHGLLGQKVAAAGDVNRDGFADFLAIAPLSRTEDGDRGTGAGQVLLFLGGAAGPGQKPDWIWGEEIAGSELGTSLAGVGDLNGDGYGDVVIGAPSYSGSLNAQGRVYVFRGSPWGLEPQPVWTIDGGKSEARCGSSICGLGDLNRDGHADFAVGSPFYNTVIRREGRVDVFFGSPTGYVHGPVPITPGPPPRSRLERALIPSLAGAVMLLGVGLWWRQRTAATTAAALVAQERERIARELHDDFGPLLSGIALMAQRALPDGTAGASADDQAASIAAAVRQAVLSLREVIWRLNAKDGSVEETISSLCEYGEQFLRLARLPLRLELPNRFPPVVLPRDFRRQLFLAVKEALHNVIKHAAAHEVRLAVRLEPGRLSLTISDDGRGFLPLSLPPSSDGASAKPPRSGIGLENLRQRVADLGGSFELQTGPGVGTAICFRLPLPRQRRKSSHWLRLNRQDGL